MPEPLARKGGELRDLSIEVIIPVQNMAGQLQKCVAPLIDQCGTCDVVTVIDDASTDRTGDIARELGAHVLRVESSLGPYHARQLAANASQADVLLFVDGRCRPLAGLLESHRQLHTQPHILLSATETRTRSGESLAARASAHLGIFSLSNFIGKQGRLDYYPTANLGVNKDAFRQVGGFRAMRSGADADLCWRIQQMTPGSMAVDARTLMEWEPRTSLRDLLSQAYRYGKSYAHLEWIFEGGIDSPHAAPSADVTTPFTRIRTRIERLKEASPSESAACFAYSLAFRAGYTKAKRRQDRFELPISYDSISS